jgi:hypothetical protein
MAILLAVFLAGPSSADVAGKSYTIWVSASFTGPPFTPFQECARFTATELTIAGCGTGPYAEVGGVVPGLDPQFVALVDCGFSQFLWLGKSVDGAAFGFGGNTMGANVLGLAELSAFGAEGLEDRSCLVAPAEAGGNWAE